mmetsp:Transcript_13664/g.29118  ORF Transcript_13664/g.29118 Transcript_13664/m.29118 type:complete len:148 (-) Transcript_13664:358-801(-)
MRRSGAASMRAALPTCSRHALWILAPTLPSRAPVLLSGVADAPIKCFACWGCTTHRTVPSASTSLGGAYRRTAAEQQANESSKAIQTAQAKRRDDDGGVQEGDRHGEEEKNVPKGEVVPGFHDEDASEDAADGVRDDDDDIDKGKEH